MNRRVVFSPVIACNCTKDEGRLLGADLQNYAFDKWMQRHFPQLPIERYADDVICHCVSEKQAKYLMKEIERRMVEGRLELNMFKTKIVVCRNENKKGYANVGFDFLGYTFRPRLSKSCRGILTGNYPDGQAGNANA